MNYNQNYKLAQITSQTLIIGVDIAKFKHVARTQDFRGLEFAKPYYFENASSGFEGFLARRMVAQAILAACLALGINAVLGFMVYRDRPFVNHHVIQLIPHAANASFPSDHAAGAFVIAMSIYLWRKRDGLFWLLFAACVAFSRVWTGVHYPTGRYCRNNNRCWFCYVHLPTNFSLENVR